MAEIDREPKLGHHPQIDGSSTTARERIAENPTPFVFSVGASFSQTR